jgi:AraC-like DNA-binding protein
MAIGFDPFRPSSPAARSLRVTPAVRVLDWVCPGHDHGRVEEAARNVIAFVRAGGFRKRVGSRDVAADPSSAIFFSRGEQYRVDHHAGCGDRCLIVVVGQDQLDEVVGRRDRRSGRFFPADRATMSGQAALLLRRLAGIAETGDPLDVEETALLLAAEALSGSEGREEYGSNATEAARRREVERARVAMAARLKEPLSLSEIARETSYSPWHLARVFREVTGRTLHQHLNRLRLLRGLDLVGSGASLSAVAFAVGFSSHSHFTAAFRREFGCPPSRLAASIDAKAGKEGLDTARGGW